MATAEEVNSAHNLWMLRAALNAAKEFDTDYKQRYGIIIMAMFYAQQLGYQVGMRVNDSELQWPVVFIELPTGQVSWHMPQHDRPFDGHSTQEKFARIDAWLEQS